MAITESRKRVLKMNEFYSCPMINEMHINFAGRLDGEKAIVMCCEYIKGRPGISFAADAATTLSNFIDARLRLINEGYSGDDKYSWGCRTCHRYQKKEWKVFHKIRCVNLSMYPSPCQCKCTYCHVHSESQIITPAFKEKYEQVFDMLEYAKRTGVIADDAIWKIACGEISIHPYKSRIIDLIKRQRVEFYTNCFIYDEQIAENLRTNHSNSIIISIDAGTPQTWFKVKGVDNFEDVMINLAKYHVAGNKPGQIVIKYIMLPGINDFEEDYDGLIEIMKDLNVGQLAISRDVKKMCENSEEESKKLMYATARLLYKCRKNNIYVDMYSYTSEEQIGVEEIVKKRCENVKE